MKALAIAVAVLSVAVTVALVVGVLAFVKVGSMANDARRAAAVQCVRSQQFGPMIADFYEKNGFQHALIQRYRDTIPKTCPTP